MNERNKANEPKLVKVPDSGEPCSKNAEEEREERSKYKSNKPGKLLIY